MASSLDAMPIEVVMAVPVAAFVSISISISVAGDVVAIVVGILGPVVTVVLAVLDGIERKIVDDDADNVGPDPAQHVAGADQRLASGLSGTGDEDNHVGNARADHSVGNRQHGWRIDYDVAELFPPAPDQLRHGFRGQHLRWIRWHVTGRDHVQAGNLLDGHRGLVREPGSREAGAETVVHGNSETTMNCGTAHIAVDEQGFLSGLRENYGEVESAEGFALLHHGAGDQNDLRRSS